METARGRGGLVVRSIWLAVLATSLGSMPAMAQTPPEPLRIGVLTDLNGPNSIYTGSGSVVAARMAAADFGGSSRGRPIEIVSGDHQNKADLGSALARRWIDVDHVAAIVDVPNSAVALAVLAFARDRAVTMFSGAGTSELTDGSCAATSFQWTYNSYAIARANARAITAAGGDTWFFITSDYAFGIALENDASALVKQLGGRVLGSVRHPNYISDFAQYLLQAQSSGARVIGLSNAGQDTINTIKQAAEFGIGRNGSPTLVGLSSNLLDVEAMGLDVAQGTTAAESFYWDLNPETRAWSERFRAQQGRLPTSFQAGVYSAVLHYLKAVDRAGSTEANAVATAIHAMPVDDFMGHGVPVRADGQVMRDIYLFTVKAPAESKGPGDDYKLRATVTATEAFRSPADSHCALLKPHG